jgi:hypothetical protein
MSILLYESSGKDRDEIGNLVGVAKKNRHVNQTKCTVSTNCKPSATESSPAES